MPPRVPIGAPSTWRICDAGAADLVGGRRGARVAIADREAADLAGRAQVALHQRRRERLHVGDVVEAVADRVGRQEGVDVDVDAEQILAPRACTRRGSGAGTDASPDSG